MADDMPPAVDDDLQELIAELMEACPEEEADDRECEEITATALSEATEYLEDPDPPSPEQVDWAEGAVISAQSAADNMASYVLDLRRGLAVFAGTGRPEEAVLRKHVAWADLYGVKITLLTSCRDTFYIEVLPADQKPKGEICISFWAEVHYDSVYAEKAS
ncbi:uncharacterized protein LOC127766321 [Oryza glaberrima]|uniref:uncharacterized protein LOC127766321 n=1 Tax=Oryza glaberrima TaxID=4538 RepID=UPI00224BF557|nr:uncharacterized protein LOC127766321 [Oryza glaberrima]